MPPHKTFLDGEEIIFEGKIVAARYGPQTASTETNAASKSLIDVTEPIKRLIAQGRTRFVGGLPISDPCPGLPKVLHVYYFSRPDDYQSAQKPTIRFQSADSIIAACFPTAKDAKSGNYDSYPDFTQQTKNVVRSGKSVVENAGMWMLIGDPAPGVDKIFYVYYY